MLGFRPLIFTILTGALIFTSSFDLSAESVHMSGQTIELPDTLGPWTLAEASKRIDSETIFDYMNGAGELYLAFHFDHLVVYEYRDKTGNSILVELYHLKSPHDAFGLLSLDWGGESVTFHASPAGGSDGFFPEALYGKGLLRVRSRNVYARILAVRENALVRKIILRLGGIITAGHNNPPPPGMVSALPPSLGRLWQLNRNRIGYFYSHLVLNSLYYLSHDNILGLEHTGEAVIAPYERIQTDGLRSRIQLLVIRYPDSRRARAATAGFLKGYLPDREMIKNTHAEPKDMGIYQVEDGWLGYKRDGRLLALVFECPDSACAEEILHQAQLDQF